MLDAGEVERRTGWRVVALDVVGSTNDELARIRDVGAGARTAVVADRQTAGRGRGGRRFESPLGGLYASVLVRVRPADLPAPTTAAVATALADAVARAIGREVAIKWPNDLWIDGRKVAGILTEASLGAAGSVERVPVIVGIGVNLAGVPPSLPSAVSAATTALDAHAGAPVRREDLLSELLPAIDARVGSLDASEGRAALEGAYRGRLALRGAAVRFEGAYGPAAGVLLDASLERGLLVRDAAGRERWWASEHVRDVRPAAHPRDDEVPAAP